jgi:hypothetical protein
VLSLIFATLMLRLGAQSTFLTICGIFMILVRDPSSGQFVWPKHTILHGTKGLLVLAH